VRNTLKCISRVNENHSMNTWLIFTEINFESFKMDNFIFEITALFYVLMLAVHLRGLH
jgi:hypothetical protein